MAIIAPTPKQQFFDANGDFLIGGLLHTTENLTDTDKITYTDASEGTPNTNPIVLNSRGECDLYLIPGEAYRLRLEDSLENLIWQEDGIIGGSSGAITVTNISSLRDASPSSLSVANVLGYYTSGDGGGDEWFWKATSTESDNGITVVELNSSPVTGRWHKTNTEEITLKQAGAVGTGVADDTIKINAAITWVDANNKTLIGTQGSYLISSSVTFGSNTRLKMEEGASFTAASNQTITINGGFEAGNSVVFGSNIVLAGLSDIVYKSRWWGTTEATLQACIDAAMSATNNTVLLQDAFTSTAVINLDGANPIDFIGIAQRPIITTASTSIHVIKIVIHSKTTNR